jgi:hypothetical protein
MRAQSKPSGTGRTRGATKVRGAKRRQSRCNYRLLIQRIQEDPDVLLQSYFRADLVRLRDLLNVVLKETT